MIWINETDNNKGRDKSLIGGNLKPIHPEPASTTLNQSESS
jgi:hypothetical protein